MLRRAHRRALALAVAPLALASMARGAEDAMPASPRDVLARAFHARYDCDSRQTLTLVLRSNGREFQRQKIDIATKFVDGRLRAVGRFSAPADLRDTAVLMLEGGAGEGDQLFVFLPTLGRVRRVSGAQRADSFMGTDLTYEDLQRPRVEDFTDFAARPEVLDNEPVLTVIARPLRGTYYDRVETSIARSDSAILRVRFFKHGVLSPFKVIDTPRNVLIADGGVVVPKRLLVSNLNRGTETEVFVEALELRAETDDRAFSTNALAVERQVPRAGTSTGDALER
jgi:hypothetical protein